MLSVAFPLFAAALLRALLMAITPATPTAAATFPAFPRFALLAAGLRVACSLLLTGRGRRLFTLNALLLLRIRLPDLGTPLAMAFLLGTPSPAVAIALRVVLCLLGCIRTRPVATL